MKIALDKERVIIGIEMNAEEFTQFDRAMFLQRLASIGEKENGTHVSMLQDIEEFKSVLCACLPR